MPTRLDGRTWLRYSISVWDDIDKSPEERELHHPAMFPAALVRRLIEVYLPPGEACVLDPFLGSGSTLVAAQDMGLSGIGIEVVPEFADIARRRLKEQLQLFAGAEVNLWREGPVPLGWLHQPGQRFGILIADARQLGTLVFPRTIDMLITSPPYWHIHTRKRTADGKQKRPYSGQADDLGNIKE